MRYGVEKGRFGAPMMVIFEESTSNDVGALHCKDVSSQSGEENKKECCEMNGVDTEEAREEKRGSKGLYIYARGSPRMRKLCQRYVAVPRVSVSGPGNFFPTRGHARTA